MTITKRGIMLGRYAATWTWDENMGGTLGWKVCHGLLIEGPQFGADGRVIILW